MWTFILIRVELSPPVHAGEMNPWLKMSKPTKLQLRVFLDFSIILVVVCEHFLHKPWRNVVKQSLKHIPSSFISWHFYTHCSNLYTVYTT